MGDAVERQAGRLPPAEAAARLGVSVGHVSWLVAQGHLEGGVIDGRMGVDADSVEALAAERARWLSYRGAAEVIGCSRETVRQMVADGRLRSRPRHGSRPVIEAVSARELAEVWGAEVGRRKREAAERLATARAASSLPPDDGYVYFDSATTALLLGISTTRLHQLVAIDRVPHVRRRRRLWYRRDHVELLAAARAAAGERSGR